MPRTRDRGGMTAPAVTTAPTPMMLFVPMRAPFMITDLMPIMTLSSTTAPWTMAECATVTPSPMTHGKPGSE